ncbi:MAG TPA: hypothetical protein VM305_10505 [Candidatus Limnocylindrales bacterium]|nr:hypothetical protein [Candidatus Limnocylindrales bacterium]
MVDVGTGDGKGVVRRARREPRTLVIGLDAAARALAATSRRAAAPARRGGLPNALFLAAAAETLPGPLAGRADEVTVVLPWGSLLRGLALPEPAQVTAVAGLLRTGARLELMLSIDGVDSSAGLPLTTAQSMGDLAARYANIGLGCRELRPASDDDVERLGSSWARRLGIPRRRPAWLLTFERG